MIAFRGTFEHTLDVKHRLTIPAKFRAALASGVVLAASPETAKDAPRSIAIWTPDAYDDVHERDAGWTQPDVFDRPRPQALLLRLLP